MLLRYYQSFRRFCFSRALLAFLIEAQRTSTWINEKRGEHIYMYIEQWFFEIVGPLSLISSPSSVQQCATAHKNIQVLNDRERERERE